MRWIKHDNKEQRNNKYFQRSSGSSTYHTMNEKKVHRSKEQACFPLLTHSDTGLTSVDLYQDVNTHYYNGKHTDDLLIKLEKGKGCKQDEFYFKNSVISTRTEAQTQTEVKSVRHRRTIFGNSFDHVITLSNGQRDVRMPASGVNMTLPAYVVANHPVEVYCSSFNNLEEMYKKLAIDKDSEIASPVVEYSVNGHPEFLDYACVELPFLGEMSTLRVWKFKSDEGLQTTANQLEVPLKGKANEDIDLFYEVKGLLFYTHTFKVNDIQVKRPNYSLMYDTCISFLYKGLLEQH